MEPWSIYNAPASMVTSAMLRDFIDKQVATGGLRESIALEIKRQPSRQNMAKAVAALANADGGILIVGLDEDSPSWENATGVPSDVTQVQVADQCRLQLTPTYVPEIIEVPLPHFEGHVLLVIRVEAATELAPLVCSGTVYRRVPGASAPATHDDIIRLVGRRDRASHGFPLTTQALINHVPNDLTPVAGKFLADAVIRVAGATWLRPSIADGLYLSSQFRAALLIAIDNSPVGIMLNRRLSGAEPRAEWEVEEVSSTHCHASRAFEIAGDSVSIHLRVTLDGPRFLTLLDVIVRPRRVVTTSPLLTEGDARLGLAESAAVMDALLTACLNDLPAVLESQVRGCVARLEAPAGWICTPSRPIASVLAIPLPRVGAQPTRDALVMHPRNTPEEAGERREMLRNWLVRSILDLGYPDAEQLIDQTFVGELALPSKGAT